MAETKDVLAVVSSGNHDLLMQAIESYRIISCYGNMDPECEEWFVVTIVLPGDTTSIRSKSLQEDYGLTVSLCDTRDEAEVIVKNHPAWD